MLYWITGLMMLAFQFAVILSRNITIPIEFFLYPWLIQKSLLQYRDFFMNHGFLLYGLLAPFSVDRSLTSIRLVYISVQAANLLLVLIILRKISNRAGYTFMACLYVILSFLVSHNHLWDEIVITTFYLGALAMITYPVRRGDWAAAVLICMSSFIKPTAVILGLILAFTRKKPVYLLATGAGWTLVGGYYLYQRAFPQLVDNLIWFSRHQAAYQLAHPVYTLYYTRLLWAAALTLGIGVIIIVRRKKFTALLMPAAFLLASAMISFIPCCFEFHALPSVAGFVLLVGAVFPFATGKYAPLFAVCLLLLAVEAYRVAKHEYVQIGKRTPTYFDDPDTMRRIAALRRESLARDRFYVHGNAVEIYYLFDSVPPVYIPVVYPFFLTYYPRLEQDIIASLESKRIDTVIVPLPLDPSFRSLTAVYRYIVSRYEETRRTVDFVVYRDRDHSRGK